VLVELVGELGDVGGDIGLQRRGQHLSVAVVHDLIEQRPTGRAVFVGLGLVVDYLEQATGSVPDVAARPLLPRLLTEHRRTGPQQPLLGFREFSLGLLRFIRLRGDGTESCVEEDPASSRDVGVRRPQRRRTRQLIVFAIETTVPGENGDVLAASQSWSVKRSLAARSTAGGAPVAPALLQPATVASSSTGRSTARIRIMVAQ
jgi:hypothetical protein